MAWWAVAAAAVPYVMSAFQDKQKMPGAPAPVQTPDRTGLINQIQDTAFNPQNAIWASASKQAEDSVARTLGRRGALNTSLGMQLQSNTQAEIAKKWLEGQAERENAALNAIVGYDRMKAGLDRDNSSAAYDYSMAKYKDATTRQANQIAGMSGMINAGVNAYNQDRMMDTYNSMVERMPQATYGTPGGNPTYATNLYAPPTDPYGGATAVGNGQYMTSAGY